MTNDSRAYGPPPDRSQLMKKLEIDQPARGETPSLPELGEATDTVPRTDIAARGEAIRTDHTDELDVELLEHELAALEEQIARLPAIRERGIPSGTEAPEELYRELIAPAWTVYDHLVEVGVFEGFESSMPRFTAEHIRDTAHQLLGTSLLTETLADNGFDEDEQTALLLNVAMNDTRLSRWVPVRDIPAGVEFNVDYVPPLYQRAMGGALLWVNALDRHLWQKRILLTDDHLDSAIWHTKAILGGLYLMISAIRDLASDDADFTDAQSTAALLGGAAILIVNQEDMMANVFWITEEERAPSETR